METNRGGDREKYVKDFGINYTIREILMLFCREREREVYLKVIGENQSHKAKIVS